MPEPRGRKIFDAGDVQDNGFYRGGTLEEGICAALTAFWIKGSIDLGVVTALNQLGSPAKWTLAQAAYEFGQLSKGATQQDDDQSLLGVVGLKEVARQTFDLSSRVQRLAAATTLLSVGSGTATYWRISMKRAGGGHSVGAQVVAGRHVVFFDANYGAYESTLGDWPSDFEFLVTTVYGGRYDKPSFFMQVELE